MWVGLYAKYSLFLSDFSEIWIFSTDFQKIHEYQISWIHTERISVWAELFHAEGQTDGQTNKHDEANSLFSKFCKSA